MPLWGPAIGSIVFLAAVQVVASVALAHRRRRKFDGKHVLITGGSKGLGFALAQEFLKANAHVTIVARQQSDLLQALQQLDREAKSRGSSSRLQALKADTTSSEELKKAFEAAERGAGPIDVLVANAGLSVPGLFVDQSVEDFERQVDVNYLGVVRSIKYVLPGMLERKKGLLVLTASMAAVVGFAGYTSYAPTKWAVRGLADCLYNELQGTGVDVSVAYPPDTDTPGYATEEITKPGICKAVNKALGSKLYPPEKVAKIIMRQLREGAYHLTTPDIGSNLLVSTMTGLSPKSLPLGMGIIMAPILQLVTSFVASEAHGTARRYNRRYMYRS